MTRLFSCCNVNWIDPANVASYRGEVVRYADEWEDRPGRIQWAEHHIVLIDAIIPSGQQELLPNLDPGSPSGFCWGYGGSGPSALGLSMLAHHLGEQPRKDAPYGGLPTAHLMHNDLVHDYISQWPMGGVWVLPTDYLRSWVQRWQQRHADLLVQRAQAVEEELAFQREMDALQAAEEEGYQP